MSNRKAILWEKAENEAVRCNLCAHRCLIQPGNRGICTGRSNVAGELVTNCYYDICCAAVDPIEKKPLFHFMPGSKVMSIATPGCNFRCEFCQNWQISMPRPESLPMCKGGKTLSPQEVVEAALSHRCAGIAYTYTEPTIFMELASDCGELAHKHGLKNIFVSNGYMTLESAEYAAGFLDAANIDLKSFSDDFYRKRCKASLSPVLETLKYLASQEHIWLEVTTLLIPGLNDSEDELNQIAGFIAGELGCHVPWHISRFHPCHKCTDSPATALDALAEAREIGKNAGLKYVFVGNAPDQALANTICSNCGQLLIERQGYQLTSYNIINNACMACGGLVDGVFVNYC